VVAAAGNCSSQYVYTYVHKNTPKGYNYYRIMQTELVGNISYSKIRVIKLLGDYAPFIIADNSVSNCILQIQVYKTTAFSLYDLNGKRLWLQRFAPGLQSIVVSKYAKGIYLLRTEVNTQKLVIQ
jgi:hypothetical protein